MRAVPSWYAWPAALLTTAAVKVSPLGGMGRYRIHGSGDLVHWFNFDPHRPRQSTALVLYLHGKIRPVITPDDPDRVRAELAAHGVNVTSGREAGMW